MIPKQMWERKSRDLKKRELEKKEMEQEEDRVLMPASHDARVTQMINDL